MLLDLVHPVLNGRETLSVSDVIGHNDTVSTLVIAAGDSLEALLACSVPNLQLDSLSVDLDGTDLEVYSDGGHEVVCEYIVCKSEQKRGLADTGVSDEEHLEEVVTIAQQVIQGEDTHYSGFILSRLLFKIIIHSQTINH